MFSICLVHFVVLAVHGIKLPGACPKDVPLSMDFAFEKSYALQIIAGVSFSTEDSSNLYKNFDYESNGQHSITCEVLNKSLSFALLTYRHDKIVKIHSTEIGKDNGIRTLISTVFANSLECYPPIIDIVHMWLEREAIILWSCEGSTKEQPLQHDEAVFILVRAESTIRYNAVELFRRVQNSTAKYLSTALMQKIPWWDPNNGKTSNIVEIPYECSSFGTVSLKELFIIIGGLSVIMICAIVVFYREKIKYKMCKRNRKIHPIN